MGIELTNYQNIILDFDGVLLDSNNIKKEAIKKAVNGYLSSEQEIENYVNYFTTNNGITREIKIAHYFEKMEDYQKVLNRYNEALKQDLLQAQLTEGCKLFLLQLQYYHHLPYVLSGADKDEVLFLLQRNGILQNFCKVMGGPLSKYQNLDKLVLNGKTLYIGDSLVDYEVARTYNFDFVFMYQYSQFNDWKNFFREKKEVLVIKNFETLLSCKC